MDNQILQDQNTFLSLRHLEKIYPNGEKAVHDFNLEIAKNEFIVIVGPSGCGKSTMLRMIAGLEDVTAGDILLEGELLNYKPSKDRKMAIVFQSYALYPQMNVYDNIAFPLTINQYPMPVRSGESFFWSELKHLLDTDRAESFLGAVNEESSGKKSKRGRTEKLALQFGICFETAKLALSLSDETKGCAPAAALSAWRERAASETEKGREALKEKGLAADEEFYLINESGERIMENRKLTDYEIKARVFETADKLDLVPYLDKLPRELSGGQMQRVALGRAIIKNVPIFMMDEPLSNLDAKLRLSMRSEIVKLHQRIGATTIYVTHDQTEAMTMATRIVVMSRGFVQQIGTPKQVYNDPANIFVARFIGSPTMNIFKADLDIAAGRFDLDGMSIEAGEEFLRKHEAFYQEMAEKFEDMRANYGPDAREKLLRILSCTGEYKNFGGRRAANKKGFAKFISLFQKRKVSEEPDAEIAILDEKLSKLRSYAGYDHEVMIGIRPERIRIEKCEQGKDYKNCYVVRPTVCELLGGEYNIHFDFCGQDVVANFDAEQSISQNDEIAVSFSPKDIYVFDPVTGGRIM